MQFWRAGRGGFVAGERVVLGDVLGCAKAARHPSGAGVAAVEDASGAVVAAVRDPGGYWSTAAVLAPDPNGDWSYAADSVTVAVSDRGDAVVVWADMRFRKAGVDHRLWVARRAPGGRFEAPVRARRADRAQPVDCADGRVGQRRRVRAVDGGPSRAHPHGALGDGGGRRPAADHRARRVALGVAACARGRTGRAGARGAPRPRGADRRRTAAGRRVRRVRGRRGACPTGSARARRPRSARGARRS